MKSVLKWGIISAVVIIAGLVVIAYSRTWNKTELEFLIHINEELVQQSVFGESPTFAIWLEDPDDGRTYTAYVTRRVSLGDWEGKKDVPVALPLWYEINRTEKKQRKSKAGMAGEVITATGATPLPGYFRTRVSVQPGSKWTCWVEYNLAGDFNETYPAFNPENNTEDEYSSGQPAILYRAEIEALNDMVAYPEISGICVFNKEGRVIVENLDGITTAKDVFDEISISVVRPRPRIIRKPILKFHKRGF